MNDVLYIEMKNKNINGIWKNEKVFLKHRLQLYGYKRILKHKALFFLDYFSIINNFQVNFFTLIYYSLKAVGYVK